MSASAQRRCTRASLQELTGSSLSPSLEFDSRAKADVFTLVRIREARFERAFFSVYSKRIIRTYIEPILWDSATQGEKGRSFAEGLDSFGGRCFVGVGLGTLVDKIEADKGGYYEGRFKMEGGRLLSSVSRSTWKCALYYVRSLWKRIFHIFLNIFMYKL